MDAIQARAVKAVQLIQQGNKEDGLKQLANIVPVLSAQRTDEERLVLEQKIKVIFAVPDLVKEVLSAAAGEPGVARSYGVLLLRRMTRVKEEAYLDAVFRIPEFIPILVKLLDVEDDADLLVNVLTSIDTLAKAESRKIEMYIEQGLVNGIIPLQDNANDEVKKLAKAALREIMQRAPSAHNDMTPTDRAIVSMAAGASVIFLGAVAWPVLAPTMAASMGFASSTSMLTAMGGGTLASGGAGVAGGSAVVGSSIGVSGLATGALVNTRLLARAPDAKDLVAFTSYAQVDGSVAAQTIFDALEKKWGKRLVFQDTQFTMHNNVKFLHLVQYVRASDNLVVVLSPSYPKRSWCLIELITASEYGVPLVPIRPIQPRNRSFHPFSFGDLQAAVESDEVFHRFAGTECVEVLQAESFSISRARLALSKLRQLIIPDMNVEDANAMREACKGVLTRLRV